MRAQSLQSCLTLCDPMDCRPPDFSVMVFSRQEDWSGLLFPSPGDLLDPGIKPGSLTSLLHWQVGSLMLTPSGNPRVKWIGIKEFWTSGSRVLCIATETFGKLHICCYCSSRVWLFVSRTACGADPVDCSAPGSLSSTVSQEFSQILVHWVSEAI